MNQGGQRASTALPAKAWSGFPLQVKDAPGPTTAWTRVVATKLLKTTATETDGTRWWEVDVVQTDGGSKRGWVREKGHAKVTLTSPWEWPGFELIEDSTTPADQNAKKVDENKLATPEEKTDFQQRGQIVKAGPLFQKLYDVIDLDKDKLLSGDELRKALQRPPLAQAISRLITRYESEWGGGMGKWDAIDKDIPEPRKDDWKAEKERIKKLQWCSSLEGNHGFPSSPSLYHFHPMGLVSNFRGKKEGITLAMLKQVFNARQVDTAKLQSFADDLNEQLEDYKLDTALRLSHFFAQVREEAGANAKTVESLDYPPDGLKTQFSYFRAHPDEAEIYGRTSSHPADQEAIANRAYSNRSGHGAVSLGEGWKYRGRGLKQLTWKGNYQSFQDNYKNVWPDESPDFINNPDLLVQPKYAVRSAVYFWLHHKLYEKADKGATDDNVNAITKTINEHTDSYEARRAHFRNICDEKVFEPIDN